VKSRARLLAPAAAVTMAATSLLLAAGASADAATCTTAPGVTTSWTNAPSASATITANACNDGVEAALEVTVPHLGVVYYYGGDVKAVGDTSTVNGVPNLDSYGYRYWADKNGTAQWYYVWKTP
jgi:hypothetical protein